MKDQNYPRVLIVGAAPINTKSATGITLLSLFSGWPLDSLAQIYDYDSEPDPFVCREYRRFSSNDIPLVRVSKRLLNRFRRKKTLVIDRGVISSRFVPSGSVSYGFLGACADLAPFSISDDIISWVKNFKPDLIYSVLGSVRTMNMVLNLSNILSIPVVPHFMDDWPATAYARSWALCVPRLILNYKIKKVISKSSARLAICGDMAQEFYQRYDSNFDYFMNCVDVPEASSRPKREFNIPVRFGYVGGLHLNRWRSLVEVVTALQELKNDGYPLSIEIYSPEADLKKYASLFQKFSVVQIMSTLKPREVNNCLLNLDVVVHVESFLESDSLYTRLSVSTKIPQYMASGCPILAHGPANLSSIKYIEKSEAGITVKDERDLKSLVRQAKALVSSKELRNKLGEKGRRVAAENHSADVERARFRRILSEAKCHK